MHTEGKRKFLKIPSKGVSRSGLSVVSKATARDSQTKSGKQTIHYAIQSFNFSNDRMFLWHYFTRVFIKKGYCNWNRQK